MARAARARRGGGTPRASRRDADRRMGAGAILARTLLCLALIGLGFVAVATDPAQWLFSQVALGIAALSETLLGLFGESLTRDGIVLRDAETGAAVAVTAACDGHGLIVVLVAAMFAWLGWGAGLGRAVFFLLVAVAAIEAFNVVRVLVLYGIGPENAAAFERAHYLTFPLASSVFVALLFAAALPPALRARGLGAAALIGLLGAGLAVGWSYLAAPAAEAALVPVADAWLGLFGPDLVAGIRVTDAGPVLETTLVTGRDPVRFATLPLRPADFMLAAPLVAAGALFLLRRPVALVLWLALALLLMALALALGAVTGAHEAAKGTGLVDMMIALGGGYTSSAVYQPPGAWSLAALKAAQNALVHFNLFVLPFLGPAALTLAGRRTMAEAASRAAGR